MARRAWPILTRSDPEAIERDPVALDRQSIEKRDFPIGRRGYEPDAVDEHLAMLADEVDALRRSLSRSNRTESLATAASEQVRLIVEAAEQSAADIEREAELEARQIRQDSRDAAEKARSDAGRQAREHVERVSESTQTMLQRADTLEGEFQGLLDSVRSSATRLTKELGVLQGAVGELRAETVPAPAPEPEPEPARSQLSARTAAERQPAPHGDPDFDFPEREEPSHPSDESSDEPQLAPDPAAPATNGGAEHDDDEEGARLIALNMALNGTPREETERYLEDNFDLDDTEILLDDVYTRAGH